MRTTKRESPTPSTNGTRDRWDAARRSWNDVNGHHIAQKRNWQYAAFGSILIALLSLGIAYNFTKQPRLLPYVVVEDKVDHTVSVVSPARFDLSDPKDQQVIKWTLARFIENLRLVSFDPTLERKLSEEYVEPFLTTNTQATQLAMEWTNGQRKQYRTQHLSLESTADDPIQFTPGVYRVNWTETLRNVNGQVVRTSHWSSFITIEMHSPANNGAVTSVNTANPLGIYVTNIDWKPLTDNGGN